MTLKARPRKSQVDRSAETRAVLVKAAISLLCTVGYGGTTTALIAKKAGVTTGALHHHFPTKDELMFAVLDHANARLQARLEAGGVLSDPTHVRALVDHLWQVYGHPEYWAVWEIIIGTRADAIFHRRVIEHRNEFIRTVLQPWIKGLNVAPEHMPHVLETFEFLLISIRGLSLERFLDKDDAYFRRHLALLADSVSRRFDVLRRPDVSEKEPR